jgi:hypothetical protein
MAAPRPRFPFQLLKLLMLKLVLLTGGLGLASVAPPVYHTYHNQRFGYHIDYPADLQPQPEADNGDGRRFTSADGQTVLTAYASYDALDGGLAASRKMARQGWQKRHATLTLDQLTRTGYALSGRVQGAIFYQQTVLKSGTLSTFIWQYPVARKAAMDAIVQHTARTWQPAL